MAYQNLNWYTRTYPNFLDDELCDAYVQMFEETLEKDAEEVKKTSICTGPVRPDGHQICGNCNCQRMNPMGFDRFEHLNTLAMSKFTRIIDNYKDDVKLHKAQWPDRYGWEELRMKRFLCDSGEQFGNHVDVADYKNVEKNTSQIIEKTNIDILINNAGLTGPTGPLWEYDVILSRNI